MGNMSYCRFENTVFDLQDCKEVLEQQGLSGTNEYDDVLSSTEFEKAIELIEMCKEIAEQFEDVDFDEERENWKENRL